MSNSTDFANGYMMGRFIRGIGAADAEREAEVLAIKEEQLRQRVAEQEAYIAKLEKRVKEVVLYAAGLKEIVTYTLIKLEAMGIPFPDEYRVDWATGQNNHLAIGPKYKDFAEKAGWAVPSFSEIKTAMRHRGDFRK